MRRPRIGLRGLLVFVAVCAGLFAWGRWFVGPICAPGYSEVRFRAIRVGDNRAQVADLIGHPLYRRPVLPGMMTGDEGSTNARSLDAYTRPGRLGGYDFRGVAFDSSGRVCKLLSFPQ